MNQMTVMASCHQPSSITTPRFGTRKAIMIRFISSPLHSCCFSNARLSKAAAPVRMVFEDQVRGVVCYRDDKGEVICEGYDEGPRFGMRLPEKACFPWPMGVQVTDFIELSTLRVFEDADGLQISGSGDHATSDFWNSGMMLSVSFYKCFEPSLAQFDSLLSYGCVCMAASRQVEVVSGT
ncbi:hypothetical protein GUJ93_ZPchr0006g42956 [Zizania palustris]|uniref:Uncharacterized protein n=1 Tax=Zizania palustris TaxID=103762 RepID=A0A8J5W285_ZIZPA|nr:hypothetical protein GUJ93_ZPchr0006g42956 [Zizania palustris]